VSTPQPPRRRRIAGEAKPGSAPAPKPAIRKKPKAKPAAKAAAPAPKAAPPAPPKPPVAKVTTRTAPPPPPPAAAAAAATETSSERRVRVPRVTGRFGLLVLLTVVAVAFGAVFGIRGFMDWRDGSGIVEAHEKAATAAASAGETIFTYQYNQLENHLRDAEATMTPAFAKKFEKIAPALQDLAPQRKIRVKATVRNAAAVECGDECRSDRATVLVFIDQARVAEDAKEPTVFGNRIQLKMAERGGRWLVDDIKAL